MRRWAKRPLRRRIWGAGCQSGELGLRNTVSRITEWVRSYVPDKWQALEVQKGEDESKELPDASFASEAELAAQSRQGRRHCLNWHGLVTCSDAVRTVVGSTDQVSTRKGNTLYSFRHCPSAKRWRLYLKPLPACTWTPSAGDGRFGNFPVDKIFTSASRSLAPRHGCCPFPSRCHAFFLVPTTYQ